MVAAVLEREVTHKVKIVLGGEELASLFWQMDSNQQALFFNYLGAIPLLPMQLQGVSGSAQLTEQARWAMSRIGECSGL